MHGTTTAHVRLPVVLGHEVARRVVQCGAGVTGYGPGDRVALLPAVPDRRCWACQQGLENLCMNPDRRILGYSVDGGMAELMLVPADAVAAGCLFVARSGLPFEQLALAEPLGAVVGGQRHTPVHVGDTGSSDIRRTDYATALELVESGRIDTASMNSHRFPLTEVGAALRAAADGTAVKVAVLPGTP